MSAVRKALEAAGEAAMESIGWPDDGSMDFEPRDTCLDAAAAAIAAFLPKAQEAYAAHYGCPSPQIGWLIAAVTAAAQVEG